MKTMNTEEIWAKLRSLTMQLSPENLHCDGEISRSQANARRREIMKQWKECERELGHKVTEDQVYDHMEMVEA